MRQTISTQFKSVAEVIVSHFGASECEMHDLREHFRYFNAKSNWNGQYRNVTDYEVNELGRTAWGNEIKACIWFGGRQKQRAQHRKAVLLNRCSSDDRTNIEKFVCTWPNRRAKRTLYCGDHLFIIPMWMATMLQMFLTLFRGLLFTIVSANLFSVVLISPLVFFLSVFWYWSVLFGSRLSAPVCFVHKFNYLNIYMMKMAMPPRANMWTQLNSANNRYVANN